MSEQKTRIRFIMLATILRQISLAILFGGSASIVFAAITLVKAAEANGIPVSEAASANAPIFIQFGRVAVGAGVALLLAESLDFAMRGRPGRLTTARYISSLLCVASTMIFAYAIVPPMEALRAEMSTNQAARESFRKLHEVSRAVFGSTILLAMVSLVVPAFETPTGNALRPTDQSTRDS